MKLFAIYPTGITLEAMKASVSNGGVLTLQDEAYRTIAAFAAGSWTKVHVIYQEKPKARAGRKGVK